MKPHRLAFLDWMRGLAAIIMLQGHVFDSFNAKDLREQSSFVLSQFVGGITPAVFLFLTGVTLAFLMDSRTRQGVAPGSRVLAALRRAGYLAIVAILFRLQLWIFAAGQSHWTDLFKVDILNAMALGIAAMAPFAILNTVQRVRWGAGAGIVIAAVSPVISALDWSAVHPFLQHYFVPNNLFFTFFPWAAFLAFGLSAGSVLRLVRPEELHRAMQWSTLIGLGLIWTAHYFATLPYSLYTNSEFWLNSPALIFIKLGVLLLLASVAFLWTRYGAPQGWSFVRQLGTTSLLVYWVHTELVYGRWFGEYKLKLSNADTAFAALAVIGVMVLLSVARTGVKHFPGVPALLRRRLGWEVEPLASPAAGD